MSAPASPPPPLPVRVRIVEETRRRVVEIDGWEEVPETGVRTSRLARFARVFASLAPLGHDAAAREASRVIAARSER